MSKVLIQRGQFVINEERRPYLTYSSFCLMALYQNGRRKEARLWLDRLQELGIDGPRLFGETWIPDQESPFFGNTDWTPYARLIDEHQPPTSALRLLPRYPKWVEQLTQDLESRGQIAEFCVIATMKHGPQKEHIGHTLNRVAQMFAKMFPADDCPYIFETINEADVHSTLTASEIALMGPRWLRNEGGDHTNFPGSLIGVSPGGSYEPSFDDSGYTHRNLHLPRGARWQLGPNGEPIAEWLPQAQAMAGRRPLALNETIHYIDKKEWREWMRVAPKWASLSTANVTDVYKYMEDVLETGTSFCLHTRVGMSTNPAEELTVLERMLKERAGNAGNPGLPGPEPPPPQPDDPGDTSSGGFWGRLLEILGKVLFG